MKREVSRHTHAKRPNCKDWRPCSSPVLVFSIDSPGQNPLGFHCRLSSAIYGITTWARVQTAASHAFPPQFHPFLSRVVSARSFCPVPSGLWVRWWPPFQTSLFMGERSARMGVTGAGRYWQVSVLGVKPLHSPLPISVATPLPASLRHCSQALA